MASSTLFPPIVETYNPAFVEECRVYFNISDFNTAKDINGIQYTVREQNTNKSVLTDSKVDIKQFGGSFYYDEEEKKNYIIINKNYFKAGYVYKIQLRFIDSSVSVSDINENPTADFIQNHLNNFSEWSTVTLAKRISEPIINVKLNNQTSNSKPDDLEVFSNIPQSVYITNNFHNQDYLESYRLTIRANGSQTVGDSGFIKNDNYESLSLLYKFDYTLESNTRYSLEYDYITSWGYKNKVILWFNATEGTYSFPLYSGLDVNYNKEDNCFVISGTIENIPLDGHYYSDKNILKNYSIYVRSKEPRTETVKWEREDKSKSGTFVDKNFYDYYRIDYEYLKGGQPVKNVTKEDIKAIYFEEVRKYIQVYDEKTKKHINKITITNDPIQVYTLSEKAEVPDKDKATIIGGLETEGDNLVLYNSAYEILRLRYFGEDKNLEGYKSDPLYNSCNVILQRTDSNSNFKKWENLKEFKINDGGKIYFVDNTVENGVWYKYNLVMQNIRLGVPGQNYWYVSNCMNPKTLEPEYDISKKEKVQSPVLQPLSTGDFVNGKRFYNRCSGGIKIEARNKDLEPVFMLGEHSYLTNSEGTLKLKLNDSIGSFKYNINQTVTTTLGSEFPFIRRNAATNYRQFDISGMISFISDLKQDRDIQPDTFSSINNKDTDIPKGSVFICDEGAIKEWVPPQEKFTFFSKEQAFINMNLYNSYFSEYANNSNYKDIVFERLFREKVMEYLYKNSVKLYKSSTEGNILVKLDNISLTPQQTLGRMIYSFSATAIEIDKCNIENYYKYNIIGSNLIEPGYVYVILTANSEDLIYIKIDEETGMPIKTDMPYEFSDLDLETQTMGAVVIPCNPSEHRKSDESQKHIVFARVWRDAYGNLEGIEELWNKFIDNREKKAAKT